MCPAFLGGLPPSPWWPPEPFILSHKGSQRKACQDSGQSLGPRVGSQITEQPRQHRDGIVGHGPRGGAVVTSDTSSQVCPHCQVCPATVVTLSTAPFTWLETHLPSTRGAGGGDTRALVVCCRAAADRTHPAGDCSSGPSSHLLPAPALPLCAHPGTRRCGHHHPTGPGCP